MSHSTFSRPGVLALLVCGVAATAAEASIPSFGRCLRAQGLPNTLRVGSSGNRSSQRLVLPNVLPAPEMIDAAFAACRRHVHWPRGFGDADVILRLRAQGRRFRECMRKLGRKPGRPLVFLVDTGVGLELAGLRGRPPARCARLLPGR